MEPTWMCYLFWILSKEGVDMPTILIVDDSCFMRQWLKTLIQQDLTCTFIEATNGREAIAQYKKQQPDIVIMDIIMPEVTGLEALQAIMHYDPDANVMICSSLGTKQNVIKALNIGAKEFVMKPFFDGLIERIRKML